MKHLEREGEDVVRWSVTLYNASPAHGMDYLVLWLDCDREGENICFEVIRCVERSMNLKPGPEQKIFRAKFSAVTPKDIQKAMANLVEPNENESLAVEARQELDLKIGVAFSRFQTRYFQGKYGDLDSAVISYGPCQTPTLGKDPFMHVCMHLVTVLFRFNLGFCVQRHDMIQTFTPEPFWTLDAAVNIDVGRGREATSSTVLLEWSRKRLFDEASTRLFMRLISDTASPGSSSPTLTCASVSVTQGRHPRPQPMNTVQMLKVASRSLGPKQRLIATVFSNVVVQVSVPTRACGLPSISICPDTSVTRAQSPPATRRPSTSARPWERCAATGSWGATPRSSPGPAIPIPARATTPAITLRSRPWVCRPRRPRWAGLTRRASSTWWFGTSWPPYRPTRPMSRHSARSFVFNE